MMKHNLLKSWRLAALAVLAGVMMIPGASMAQLPEEKAGLSLDFLGSIKQGIPWLQEELAARGLRGRYEIKDGRFHSDELDVLRYFNRIRAFANLDQARTGTYYSLKLVDDQGRSARCVTRHPRDYLPELGVLDFRRDEFPVDNAAAERFDPCLVAEGDTADFVKLDRETFRQTYFFENGELDINRFSSLSSDLLFIATAIDLGFLPFEGQLSGNLQIRTD